MRLTSQYVPVCDLGRAFDFYRDTLGFDEAWREGSDTVAFSVPGTKVELMLGLTLDTDAFDWFAGPMYEVDDLDAWMEGHTSVMQVGPVSHTPPVRVLPCRDPEDNGFYVYELDRS